MRTMSEPSEREIYLVEGTGDKKVIHVSAYVWPRSDGDGYTITEYTFLYIPLAEMVRMDDEQLWDYINDMEANVKQYERDVSAEEAKDYIDNAWGMAKRLDYKDLTEDTPCGVYWAEV